MNPEYFGSDPADIQLRIRCNPEIRIRVLNHLWLTLDALAEVCALWAQSSPVGTQFLHLQVIEILQRSHTSRLKFH